MIRTVDTKIITENVKEMCIEANHYLSKDMDIAMKNAVTTEKSELGRKILNQLQDNLKIADEERIQEWQLSFWKWGRMFILRERRLRMPSTRACVRVTRKAICGNPL